MNFESSISISATAMILLVASMAIYAVISWFEESEQSSEKLKSWQK